MKGNPVAWFEIYVHDLERAKRFYEEVFQVSFQKLNAPFPGIELWAFPSDMEKYGACGALVKMEGCVPAAGCSTLVYFSCDDCATEAARAAASGGKVERPKMSIGEYGFISLIVDTEGNVIGLHSMK